MTFNVQHYLLFYMMKFVENQGQTVYNVFPLRSDIIPKYICFDTTSLIKLFITVDNREKFGTK